MNQKGFANIVLIVLVVVLVGALGYVTLVKKPASVEQSQTNNSQNTQPTIPTAQIPSPSENLEKYQDADSRFQFNFPNTWKVVQYKTGLKGSPESYSYIQSPDFNQIVHEGEESYYELKQGAEISVYVQVSPSAKTIKDLQEFNKLGRGGPAFVNERIIKVDGKDALLYDFTGYGGSSGHHLELLNNNRWIKVSMGYKGLDGKKIFDKIISTFNFLNQFQKSSDKEVSGLVSFTIPSYCSFSGSTEKGWIVDCGKNTKNDARGFMGRILETQGWKFCDSGLANAHWWKNGVITGVSESENDSSAASYPFHVSQSKGVECQ